MEKFRFQTRTDEENHRLSETARVVNFDRSNRRLVLEFDLSQDNMSEVFADLEMHIYRGCQNLWFQDVDGTAYSVVVDPSNRIPDKRLAEVRYVVHACVED